jgi:Peptidase family M48
VTPAQLARLFAKERDRFAAWYPRVRNAELVILPGPCPEGIRCKERSVAYAVPQPMHIAVVRRLLEMPRENVVAVIRHEFGHLADKHLSYPGREQRADDIAEQVAGHKIRYDKNDIQTTSPNGRYPRPPYLHK